MTAPLCVEGLHWRWATNLQLCGLRAQRIALQTVNWAKCGKRVKNADNAQKTWILPEKHAASKLPVEPYKRNLLWVDEKK